MDSAGRRARRFSMFGWTDTPRDRISELQGHVRTLDRALSRMRDTLSVRGREAEHDLREAAHNGYDDMLGYVRAGAERLGEGATQLRRHMADADLSVDRFAKQLGVAPVVILGLAVGVGALIAATQIRTSSQPQRTTARRRPRVQNRKA
jgi:hypothetical protein